MTLGAIIGVAHGPASLAVVLLTGLAKDGCLLVETAEAVAVIEELVNLNL